MADERNELEVFRRLRRRAVDPVLVHAREVARGAAQRVREPFMFEGAGRRAPREVQKAIERFRRLPLAVRAQTRNLWGYILGGGTPAFKARQDEVQYGPPPPNLQQQRCANCVSFYVHVPTNTGICDSVRGVIAPQAWCRKWAPSISPAAYAAYQNGEP